MEIVPVLERKLLVDHQKVTFLTISVISIFGYHNVVIGKLKLVEILIA